MPPHDRIRKTLVFTLVVVCCAALLSVLVCLVLAGIALAEGNLKLMLQGMAGAAVSGGIAWVCGGWGRGVKDRSFERQIAEHAAAIADDLPVAALHYNAGVGCLLRREFPQAVARFDAVLRLDPHYADAYVGRVNACVALGWQRQVIADYTRAIESDPSHALAWCARATAWNASGQFYRAIPDATEAIRLNPELYLGYDCRGWGLLQRSRYNAPLAGVAISWWLLTGGFLRDAINWTELTTLGTNADAQGAVADFTEALRLNPGAADCYQGRALAWRVLRDDARAEADESRRTGLPNRL